MLPLKPDKRKARAAFARAQALADWRGIAQPRSTAHRQHAASALVPKWLESVGLDRRCREEEISAAWSQVVGAFAAAHSHPQRLHRGLLTVAVSQSAVLFTLDRTKPVLLARLQERFGSDVIRDLRFRAG